MAKVVVVVWLVASTLAANLASVWSFFRVRDQERTRMRTEAQLTGRLEVPSVMLFAGQLKRGGGDLSCRLTNTGDYVLAEATVAFGQYAVQFKGGGSTRRPDNDRWPDAATHELKPREPLIGVMPEFYYSYACHGGRAPCLPSEGCRFVIECQAQYRRAADFERFATRQFLFLEEDCTTLPLEVVADWGTSSQGEYIRWRDPSYQAAYRRVLEMRDEGVTTGGLSKSIESLLMRGVREIIRDPRPLSSGPTALPGSAQ